jgi:WD40 repeat protein/energy-coupling factor transporter ATP-binding protein EcfA2
MTSAGSPSPDNPETGFLSLAAVQAGHTTLLRNHREAGDTAETITAIRRFLEAGVASGRMLDGDQDRWAVQSILDYWVTTLHRATGEIPDANLADFDPDLAPTLDDSLCPYLGLDAFKTDQRDRYFGRQQLVGHLIDRLRDTRLLALLGPSGSGKSSLVLAGILPTLQEGALPGSNQWIYYPPMVPGADPLENLARLTSPGNAAEQRISEEAKLFRQNPDHLTEVVGRQNLSAVIVIDQFEEVFTLCTDEGERQAFVENLLRLTRAQGPRHTVILTMRDDFLGQVSRLPSLAPQFDKIIAVVVPPTAAELRDAIEKPAERIGLKFEEGLVELLLKDVVNEPAGLPLLQFTLLKLWEARDHNRITRNAYDRLGGGRECLARSADVAWEALGLEQNRQAGKRILLELVRPTEGREFTSKRVRRARLYKLGVPDGQITLALDRLVKARLLRVTPGQTSEDDRIEVAHEALVRNWPKLSTWLEEERERLRHRITLTAAAEQWIARSRDRNLLYRGDLLEEAAKYQDLGEVEGEFVGAGLKERDRDRFKKKAYWSVGVAMVVITVAALVYGLISSFRASAAQALAKQQSAEQAMQASQMAATQQKEANANLTREKNTSDSLRSVAETQQAIAASALGATQAGRPDNLGLRAQRSVLLALYAMSVKRTPAAEVALDQATVAWGMPEKLNGQGRSAASFTIATTPDRRFVAIPTADSTVAIWDLHRGAVIRTLIGHTAAIRDVAFNHDGTRLATASDDGTAKLWDVTSGRELRTFHSSNQPQILALQFGPGDSILVAGGSGGRALIWNVASGELVRELKGLSSVWDLAFSPDGNRLATAGGDHRVLLWDTHTWQLVDSLGPVSSRHREGIAAITYSRDGQLIATASFDSTVKIWSKDGVFQRTLAGHGDYVWDVSFSADGSRLASAGSDGTVRIWDVLTGRELRILRGHAGSVFSLTFLDGKRLISVGEDGDANVWDLSGDWERQRLIVTSGSTIALAPDGLLAIGTTSGRIEMLQEDRAGGDTLREGGPPIPQSRNKAVRSLAFATSGRKLVAASPDTVKLWIPKEQRPRWTWPSATVADSARATPDVTSKIWSVALSPDGDYVAIAALDSVLRILNAADGTLRQSIRNDKGEVVAVAFNPTRPHQLATAGQDHMIRIQDAQTGVVEDSISAHRDLILHLAFNPAGTRLASASADGTVRLWNLHNRTAGNSLVLEGHTGWVWDVSFNHDGTLVASTGNDSTVRIWNSTTGEEIRRIILPGASSRSIQFDASDRVIIAGLDGTVRVYPVSESSPDTLIMTARRRLDLALTGQECQRELEQDPCPVTVEALLVEARSAAARGDRAHALAAFSRAQARDDNLGVDPNGFIRPLLTTYYVRQSAAAARRGAMRDAASALERARDADPTLPWTSEPEARRLYAANMLRRARLLAGAGAPLDSVKQRLRIAVENDPSIAQLDPAAEAALLSRLYRKKRPSLATENVSHIDDLIRQGKMTDAFDALDSALAMDSTKVTALHLNSACWNGALRGWASRVLRYCERAVALSPTTTGIRDSRGVARALTGDVKGAIEDFESYTLDPKNAEASRSRRTRWLEALKAGTPPGVVFSASVRNDLLSES